MRVRLRVVLFLLLMLCATNKLLGEDEQMKWKPTMRKVFWGMYVTDVAYFFGCHTTVEEAEISRGVPLRHNLRHGWIFF